ncbi:MAG TPA: hypothetical protein VFF73_35515 [Planctomycetota bacterium]|nr:hypothetical protein [Planctomycetota bacterium]
MRALKTELETFFPIPAEVGTRTTPSAVATPPTHETVLARDLENAIAQVLVGGPSRLFLALAPSATQVGASFAEAARNTRGRTLVVPVSSGPSLETRALEALVPALRARTNGRPGVAALLDPLIKSAAAFVLGSDQWSLEAFLKPEALDEVPAVASRVLLQRFVPALAAQLPGVPVELLTALVTERTGSGDASAELAAVPPRALLEAVARIATRAQAVIVFSCPAATDHAAAAALDAACALETAPQACVWALGCTEEAWSVQRALLSDAERRAIEAALRKAAPMAAVAEAPVEAASPAPGRPRGRPEKKAKLPSFTGADDTPPLKVGRGLATKPALKARLKKSVAARLDRARARAAARSRPASASASRPGATTAASREPYTPPAPVSSTKKAILVAIPFLFLASLGVFARRDTITRGRGPTPDWALKLIAKSTPVRAPTKPTPAPPPAPQTRLEPPKQTVAATTTPPPAPAPAPAPAAPAEPVLPAPAPSDTLEKQVQAQPTLMDKLMTVDRAPRGEEAMQVLCKLFDRSYSTPEEASLLKRGVLLRLANYRSEQEALDRMTQALDPANPREVRIGAIQALTMAPGDLPAAAKDKLSSIAKNDQDDAVKQNAALVVGSQP